MQDFTEYGVYSIDQFTMNTAVDVDFTQDGRFLALTSLYGTLSLYTTSHHLAHRYQYTRVQQFFAYDNEMHDYSPLDQATSQPQLCGFELNPYEQQPPPPIIGRFKSITDLTHEEFERQLIFAKEFATEEEKFYQD